MVRGRPVMEYCVDRMQRADPGSIRLVTRPAKTDLVSHATEVGLEVILAETRSSAHSIALGVNGLEPDDIVLIGLADTIWDPVEGFRALVDQVALGSDIALGLFQSSEPERSDVVILGDGRHVIEVLVKPAVAPSDQIWGCAAARVRALSGIEDFDQPGQFFDRRCREVNVTGIWLSDHFVDIGTPEQLLRWSDPPSV